MSTNNMLDYSYNFRKHAVRDYQQLTSIKLPRESKKQAIQKLYPMEVVDRYDSQVRIHYIGYDDEYDEWREADGLVPLNEDENRSNITMAIIQPFNLYYEVGVKH